MICSTLDRHGTTGPMPHQPKFKDCVWDSALYIVTLSVCCVTGTDNDTVTDYDTDTYTDTVDTDAEAACKLYFVAYYTYHAVMICAHLILNHNEPCVMDT